jgi:hypothetical protein
MTTLDDWVIAVSWTTNQADNQQQLIVPNRRPLLEFGFTGIGGSET